MNRKRVSILIGSVASLLMCCDLNASSTCYLVHSSPPKPVSLTPLEDYIRRLEVEYQGIDNIPYVDQVFYIQVEPVYPSNAIELGIEGWCVVNFDVQETGQTRNLKITQCSPVGVFEEVSLKAISHFLFRPAILRGEPVKSYGLEYRFTFDLDNVSQSDDCEPQA